MISISTLAALLVIANELIAVDGALQCQDKPRDNPFWFADKSCRVFEKRSTTAQPCDRSCASRSGRYCMSAPIADKKPFPVAFHRSPTYLVAMPPPTPSPSSSGHERNCGLRSHQAQKIHTAQNRNLRIPLRGVILLRECNQS